MNNECRFYVFVGISVLILSSALLSGCGSLSSTQGDSVLISEPTQSAYGNVSLLDSLKGARNMHIDATYSDGSMSVNEMYDRSSMVIRGTVIKQIQFSPVAVMSTVKISQTYMGESFDTVKLYQLGLVGDSDVLYSGQSYVLFLGYQKEKGINDCYTIGGPQGVVRISASGLFCSDPVMMRDITEIEATNSAAPQTAFFNWLVSIKK